MYYHHFLQRSVCHILFLHSWADRLSVTFYSSSLSSAEYLSVCLSQFYLHFLEQGVCLFVFHVYPHYLSVCLSPFILTFLIIWSPFVWLVGGCGALAALSIEHLPTLLRYESSTLILYKELSSTIFQMWVCQSGIGNTSPDLHFLQYIKAWMSSTDPVSSITNCCRLIVSYTDPVHSFIIS